MLISDKENYRLCGAQENDIDSNNGALSMGRDNTIPSHERRCSYISIDEETT